MKHFFLFSFISILLKLCQSSFPHNQSLKHQASILVSLKQEFEVPNSLLGTWDLKNYLSLCSWTGIKCDTNNKTIVHFDISNQNISGSFSPLITKLHTLVNISISGNSFSGTFPNELHKLPFLQLLNISNNQFNGSLNWKFSEFKNLIGLDIYDNSFSGSLPEGITEVKKLKYLDFGGNFFAGKIPSTYGSFKQLEYLSLAGNDLVGFIPSQLSNLTNLQNLRLGYYNQFEGGVPIDFGNLINLVHLDLSSCGLKGSIPQELGKLSKLDTLYLQTNQLTGSMPPQIANLTSLKTLDLSNNALTGQIPGEFSSLKNLTLLNLFINKFHGEIPNSIADLPNLEVLKLWQNNFTGWIPSTLGRNGKIVELDLSTNKLTGLVPKWLCFGRKLKTLILLNNFLFGSLPEELGTCESLVKVRMGKNYLTGSIPKGFLYLPEVALIELQNNYLSGNYEEDVEKLPTKLAQLNLSNNRLSNSIPGSVGNFSSLKELSLSGNQFTGEIPLELSKLKNLLNLDLSKNNLSGDIPIEISYCSSLTYLDLSQNQLSGPIPSQLSEIHNLNYLNLSFNFFNQTLPMEIGFMKSLTSADFSHNNLSGKVPENGQFSVFNSTSYIGNPLLCGFGSNPCNSSSFSPFQNNKESIKSKIAGKYKLIFALGLLLFSLVFAVLAIIRIRKVRKNENSWKLMQFQKLEFTSENILECVKDENEVGRGGAGIVYRGTMPNGELVAVKKLLGINKGSSHDNGLSAEIQTLGKIRHRNIVRLLAFCSNKDTNLLVYEYMSNGSLGEVLHGKRGGYLNWEIRLKIAIEAAKGLCYLHHDCSPLVIHRDIKSNNILLNPDFEAHVADFGLAKFLQDNGTSECMSAIAGSYGYIAPEYAYTLKVDEKSDVYSYGVVLLELITGRRPVGGFGEDGMDIVQWAKVQTNWAKEGVIKILDERLKKVPTNEAMQVFFVAMLCVEEHSVERPTMREVVQMLAQAKQPNTFHLL